MLTTGLKLATGRPETTGAAAPVAPTIGVDQPGAVTEGRDLEVHEAVAPETTTTAAGNEPYTPRDDQFEAVLSVSGGFKEDSRGQLIVPCGYGKTLTALWSKEKLAYDAKQQGAKNFRTLVLVPSLDLVRQFKDEWKAQEGEKSNYLCVCSKPDVDKQKLEEEDGIAISPEELDSNPGARVTTDAGDIKGFLEKNPEGIVYSTYQSLDKVVEAMQDSEIKFDLTVCDEAHETAGSMDKQAAQVLDDDLIPSDKRLYLTATPKVLGENGEEDAKVVAAMDNPDLYGPEFYRMSYAEAIKKKIVTDYKVIAVGVKKSELPGNIDPEDPKAKDILHAYALKKVMNKYPIKHALSFHSRTGAKPDSEQIGSANGFAQILGDVAPKTYTDCIHGGMPVTERRELIDGAMEFDKSVLTNVKCLTQGIDEKRIDSVFFTNPKSSVIDIVQACGRAIRVNPDDPEKTQGYIIVPILHDDEGNLEGSIEDSGFKTLLNVVHAMSSTDERLAHTIVNASQQGASALTQTETNGDDESAPEFFDFPIKLNDIHEAKLQEAIFTQLLRISKQHLSTEEVVRQIRELYPTRPTVKTKAAFLFSPEIIAITGCKTANGLNTLLGIKSQSLKATFDVLWSESKQEAKNPETVIKQIRELQPTQPIVGNMEEFLFSPQILDITGCRTRAALNNLLSGSQTQSIKAICDLLWPESKSEEKKDLPTVIQELKELHYTKPVVENYKSFFFSDAIAGITGCTTRAQLRSLFSESSHSLVKIFDRIWTPKFKSLEEMLKAIRDLQPIRPKVRTKNDFLFSPQVISITGCKSIASLKDVFNLSSLSTKQAFDLIWPESKQRTKSPKEVIDAMRQLHPTRPSGNKSTFLTSPSVTSITGCKNRHDYQKLFELSSRSPNAIFNVFWPEA